MSAQLKAALMEQYVATLDSLRDVSLDKSAKDELTIQRKTLEKLIANFDEKEEKSQASDVLKTFNPSVKELQDNNCYFNYEDISHVINFCSFQSRFEFFCTTRKIDKSEWKRIFLFTYACKEQAEWALQYLKDDEISWEEFYAKVRERHERLDSQNIQIDQFLNMKLAKESVRSQLSEYLMRWKQLCEEIGEDPSSEVNLRMLYKSIEHDQFRLEWMRTLDYLLESKAGPEKDQTKFDFVKRHALLRIDFLDLHQVQVQVQFDQLRLQLQTHRQAVRVLRFVHQPLNLLQSLEIIIMETMGKKQLSRLRVLRLHRQVKVGQAHVFIVEKQVKRKLTVGVFILNSSLQVR